MPAKAPELICSNPSLSVTEVTSSSKTNALLPITLSEAGKARDLNLQPINASSPISCKVEGNFIDFILQSPNERKPIFLSPSGRLTFFK